MPTKNQKREAGRGRKHARDLDKSRRNKAPRPSPTTVLILTNGWTEKAYLTHLIKRYQRRGHLTISVDHRNADVRGLWDDGRGIAGEGFDHVFLVFDRDYDHKFPAVADLARRHGDKRLHFIPSSPCFEYWLLLHFERTDRAYHPVEGDGGCAQQVMDDLRQHALMKGYAKSGSNPDFATLIDQHLNTACANAAHFCGASSEPAYQAHPISHMHELVERLKTLSAP